MDINTTDTVATLGRKVGGESPLHVHTRTGERIRLSPRKDISLADILLSIKISDQLIKRTAHIKRLGHK